MIGKSMIAVDVSNLGACNYATNSAIYNIGGIQDGNKDNLQQIVNV
jgi:hypothetical protein